DGTPAGTALVKDINPGSAGSSPSGLTAVGDRLFFSAQAPGTGRELWVSDRTPEGTTLVQDILPGTGSSNPQLLKAGGGQLFFTADDLVHGRELWVLATERVERVVLNDGSAQRSRVTSLTVTFTGAVTIDPGAFELLRQGGSPVSLSVAVSVVDGRTIA